MTLLNVYSAFEAVQSKPGPRTCLTGLGLFQAGKKQSWCGQNHLNFKGLLRAANIRDQLKRLIGKYAIPLVSTKGLLPSPPFPSLASTRSSQASSTRRRRSGAAW